MSQVKTKTLSIGYGIFANNMNFHELSRSKKQNKILYFFAIVRHSIKLTKII